mmetsp:Transcript_23901/g.70074  ORF Transcript_23901/g.70074 Transcript_23901/m.70074 type:complete len:162 (+) Transcript_23901:101-586(+)
MKLKIEAVTDEEALGQAGAPSSPGGHMTQALDHKAAGIQAFRAGRPAEAQEWFKRGLEAALVCRDGQDITQSEAAAATAAAVELIGRGEPAPKSSLGLSGGSGGCGSGNRAHHGGYAEHKASSSTTVQVSGSSTSTAPLGVGQISASSPVLLAPHRSAPGA